MNVQTACTGLQKKIEYKCPQCHSKIEDVQLKIVKGKYTILGLQREGARVSYKLDAVATNNIEDICQQHIATINYIEGHYISYFKVQGNLSLNKEYNK